MGVLDLPLNQIAVMFWSSYRRESLGFEDYCSIFMFLEVCMALFGSKLMK